MREKGAARLKAKTPQKRDPLLARATGLMAQLLCSRHTPKGFLRMS